MFIYSKWGDGSIEVKREKKLLQLSYNNGGDNVFFFVLSKGDTGELKFHHIDVLIFNVYAFWYICGNVWEGPKRMTSTELPHIDVLIFRLCQM